ncbi:hypothetical protein BDQ17DRAFT_1365258 [Cyathus striatus]|nr:hypothetical protein BDQ17DRAFT_1365258 [Cyathus striatus]
MRRTFVLLCIGALVFGMPLRSGVNHIFRIEDFQDPATADGQQTNSVGMPLKKLSVASHLPRVIPGSGVTHIFRIEDFQDPATADGQQTNSGSSVVDGQ